MRRNIRRSIARMLRMMSKDSKIRAKELPELWQVSIKTIYRWTNEENGIHHRKVNGCLFCEASEVQKWLKKKAANNDNNN